MIGEVSAPAALALGAAFGFGCIDLYAVARERRRVEMWSDPAVVLSLLAAGVLLQPADTKIRWLVVGGLALAVVSALLSFVEAFEMSLSSVLVGYILYIAAFMYAWHSWPYSLAALVVGLVLIGTVGRRIAAAAATYDDRLELLILGFQVTLVLTAVVGFGTTHGLVMVAVTLFVLGETYLGWTRFLGRESRPSRVIVHAANHVAQACLVIALVTLAAS